MQWQAVEVTETVLFVIVAVLAIGEFLLFGALAEAYRDIAQLREHSGITDNPAPVDLADARDKLPSSLGLHPDLDATARAIVPSSSTWKAVAEPAG